MTQENIHLYIGTKFFLFIFHFNYFIFQKKVSFIQHSFDLAIKSLCCLKMTKFNTHPINILCINPILLDLTEPERNHGSWSRIGYHVFLSRFNKCFSSMNVDDRNDLLVLLGVWLEESNDDTQSCNSTLTNPTQQGSVTS